MRILRSKEQVSGFWAIELHRIIPEMADCGDVSIVPRCRLDPHLHRHWELMYQIEGVTECGIMGGRTYTLSPGSSLCIAPNVNHWLQRKSNSGPHEVFVGFDLRAVAARHPRWESTKHFTSTCFIREALQLERAMTRLIHEVTVSSMHQISGLRLALDTLILEVVRTLAGTCDSPSSVAMHSAVLRAKLLLESRFREPWDLHRLAEQAGISRARLIQLFRRETGTSVHKFLNKMRVRHAETLLLDSQLPVSAVASESGFATGQHFARIFKQVNGLQPLEFRRRHRRA